MESQGRRTIAKEDLIRCSADKEAMEGFWKLARQGQVALFDVVGKILDVPVYKLLGSKVRDHVPISWWSIDASPGN